MRLPSILVSALVVHYLIHGPLIEYLSGILFIIPFACPFVCFQLRALILTVTDSAPIAKHMVDIGYDEEIGTIVKLEL